MAEEARDSNPAAETAPAAAAASAANGAQAAQRKKKLTAVLRIVLVLLLIGGALYWWHSRKFEETDDAQVDGHIDPVSARISGHVVGIHAEAGQFVKAGTVLVEIDDRDYQVAVEKARAEYLNAVASEQAAKIGVPITEVGSSSEIRSAEADVLNAEAGVAAATRQVEEAEARLVQAQADAAATSANSMVTAATASVHSAKEVVKQAQARLAQAHAALSNARITPKQIAVSQAHARAGEAQSAKAKAALDQTELNLGYTRIVAPADGIVGNRTVQLGQNVQAGQELLSIVPMKEIWVTANYKETQLARMRPGQHVEIAVDALGGEKFPGTVTSIGGATGARFSLLPPENATGSYVKVVQRVPVRIDFDGRDKPDFNRDGHLRPGLSVVPSVRVR